MVDEKPTRRFGWAPLAVIWALLLAEPSSREFALVIGAAMLLLLLVFWIVSKIAGEPK